MKLLTLLGKGSGAQLATGTSVVTTGPGQVIVTQPFAELAVCEAHVATGSFTVLLSLQVVARQLLLPLAGSSTQVCTATFVLLLVPQLVARSGAGLTRV